MSKTRDLQTTFDRQSRRNFVNYSANLPIHVFENPEVLKLVSMLRSAAPAIMPSAKLIGSRLLNDAAEIVYQKMLLILKD